MKVYLLIQRMFDETDVLGCFSNLEEAENKQKELETQEFYGTLGIIEFNMGECEKPRL